MSQAWISGRQSITTCGYIVPEAQGYVFNDIASPLFPLSTKPQKPATKKAPKKAQGAFFQMLSSLLKMSRLCRRSYFFS